MWRRWAERGLHSLEGSVSRQRPRELWLFRGEKSKQAKSCSIWRRELLVASADPFSVEGQVQKG